MVNCRKTPEFYFEGVSQRTISSSSGIRGIRFLIDYSQRNVPSVNNGINIPQFSLPIYFR